MPNFVPMKELAGFLTPEQINVLIDAAHNERDRVLFTVLARSCRRVSEIIRSLKPKDIRWEDGLIEWTILKKNPRRRRDDGSFAPKNEEPVRRLKPISRDVLSMLGKYIRSHSIRDDEFVFDISRQRVDQILQEVGKEVGIEKVGEKKLHAHHFRHSYLVEAAKKCKNPKDIVLLKELAEHSKIETTMFYLQFSPQHEKELVNRMFRRVSSSERDAREP